MTNWDQISRRSRIYNFSWSMIINISADEDPGVRFESFAIINTSSVPTKNSHIMYFSTYKRSKNVKTALTRADIRCATVFANFTSLRVQTASQLGKKVDWRLDRIGYFWHLGIVRAVEALISTTCTENKALFQFFRKTPG